MIAFDFFCGGGGLSKGLELAGIEVIAGFDIIEGYRATYEHNHQAQFICADIRDIDKQTLTHLYPRLRWNKHNLLLAGCAPCQPFSSQQKNPRNHNDRTLLDSFGRIVDEVKPGFVLLENVPGIISRGEDVFQRFLNTLTENQYYYYYGVLNAKNYGVPQNRRRFILIASRYIRPEFPATIHGANLLPYVTVREAIAQYPPIGVGETHPTVPNHQAAIVSELNLERLMNTPQSGGSRTDWPERLFLECHKGTYTGHTDVYGRMDWEKVAPTLTSKCCSISNGRYGHPVQNRAISFREAARLQSFDDNYIFFGSPQSVCRQIGNAVPVQMARVLGENILDLRARAQIRGQYIPCNPDRPV